MCRLFKKVSGKSDLHNKWFLAVSRKMTENASIFLCGDVTSQRAENVLSLVYTSKFSLANFLPIKLARVYDQQFFLDKSSLTSFICPCELWTIQQWILVKLLYPWQVSSRLNGRTSSINGTNIEGKTDFSIWPRCHLINAPCRRNNSAQTIRGVATGGVCRGGVSHPPKIFKNRENSGKLRENSVTSGNICGC